ncbi:MAG: hypothetical protein NTZ44_03720 [Candidatus Nomurabacteria bacterium]|nr:hypothetical protein [Candidatus Nomurabacteria bacterium]
MKDNINKINIVEKICILVLFILIFYFINIYFFKKPKITLGTFTEIPKDLMDSGCTFYWNQSDLDKKEIALIDTFGSGALIVINGNSEKLKEVRNGDLLNFSNDKFEVKINIIKSTLNNNEGTYEEGILTVIGKDGESTSKNVLGYCGS